MDHSRLSVALQSKGFAKGSKIHIVTNNNIHYHPLLLAAWRLGGVPSCGDSALNADTIQYQVTQSWDPDTGCKFHQLADLSWVDSDLATYAVCPILVRQMAFRQKWLSSCWEHLQSKSIQPKSSRLLEHPVVRLFNHKYFIS